MMVVAKGWTVAIQVSQTARTSSPKLSAQLLKGSGLAFTAARAQALVPCEVRATPPAMSAAPQRHSGAAPPAAAYASSDAAGGRMKVWTASRTVKKAKRRDSRVEIEAGRKPGSQRETQSFDRIHLALS